MFAVSESALAYYEAEAGYVRPEAAVAAQLGLAARAARACASRSRCSNGAPRRKGRDLFAAYRQLLLWFPLVNEPPALDDMPIFIWDFGGEPTGFVPERAVLVGTTWLSPVRAGRA